MAGIRELFVDLQNGRLVTGFKDPTPVNSYTLSRPFHQDQLNLNWHFLSADPTGDPRLGSFRVVSVAGAALTVKLYLASDTSVVLASQTVWLISNPDQTQLSGILNLNTVAMAAAIAAIDPTDDLGAILEATLVLADGQYTIRYDDFRIRKQLNVAGVPVATLVARYLTADECMQLFVQFVNNQAGASIQLTSKNGLFTRELRCNDDGSNAGDSGQ